MHTSGLTTLGAPRHPSREEGYPNKEVEDESSSSAEEAGDEDEDDSNDDDDGYRRN